MGIILCIPLFLVASLCFMKAWNETDVFLQDVLFLASTILIIGGVSALACLGCNCGECQLGRNGGKSGRTIMAEKRRKTVDTQQKFLSVVKDDPDFKIYFEQKD